MSARHDPTFRQLTDRAARVANFYFDPIERAQMLTPCGQSATATSPILIENRFVPLTAMPATAPLLRRFARGTPLDDSEKLTLENYGNALNGSVKQLHAALVISEPIPAVKTLAKSLPTWPAVSLVDSREEMQALLHLQFERVCQNRISFRADSSTHIFPTPGGVYIYVQWFWHGS